MKVFNTRISFEHRRVPPSFFRHCGTKNFLRKHVIPALLSKFYSRYQKFSETRGSSLRNFFRHCETKIFRRKNVIPSLLSIFNSRYQNISETQESPLKNFSVLFDKKSPKECDELPPMHESFLNEDFVRAQKVSSKFLFPRCETENFRRKNVIRSLLSIPFFHNKTFQKHKGPPYECFRHCETRSF